MSDLETRLAEALRTESVDAPDALGLADAARRRASARRRTRAAAGLAAVAALAVPVAVVAFGGDDDGKAPVALDSTSPGAASEGRWESWRGVTVRVPEDWEYGAQSAWCADDGSVETFRVTRPGGVTPAIACTPRSSYGLSFQEIEMEEDDEPFDWPVVAQTGDAWPPGTFVGARGVDGVLVMVAGPDRDLVADVLATVSVYRPVDPNGCSAEDDGGPGMAGTGEVPVCRYDDQGRLVQSEKLTGEDAAEAVQAVRAAPREDGVNLCDNPESEYVVMGVEGDRFEVRYAGDLDCADQGVFIEGLHHALTADVLYWALSPGWAGGVAGHVPLPDPLRR